ncbi:hypothetical protein BD769DRAFT_1395077 [Suillus cothurnatus]|nr:hypothetical protein BD769DRAFT_1395077 [Suillus cothurnatus]
MPRIRNDSNFNVCPDYASDVFANSRAQLVNDNTNEAQAIQLLKDIWEANNNSDKVAWQRIPDEPAIMPCSYALRKLDKGEYVKLWYFTNDGLDEANLKKTVDDDAMIMSTLADGSTAWVSAASTRNARAVINDEDLPFEEFCQACPRMLTAMEQADWPEDRVRMMVKFWRNIQVHKYRSL